MAIPQVELFVVLWTRKFIGAVHVVVGVPIGWEKMASTDSMDRQRMGFLSVGSQCTAEDRGRIELVTTQLAR